MTTQIAPTSLQAEPSAPSSAALDLRVRRDSARFVACLLVALALHGLLSLSRVQRFERRALPVPALSRALEPIPVWLEDAAPSAGGPPGGGSDEAAPDAQASSLAQPVAPRRRAPRVPVAPKHEAARVANHASSADAEALSPDFLAAALGESLVPVRPRAERVLLSGDPRGATAPEAAQKTASDANAQGTGPGRNGGPGGEGHGSGGVVRQRFAFGGPSGAFRADVCFIDKDVKSLKQLPSCPPQVTFFADTLNVPPRRFNDGFPGVSERTEWFAIRYRGKFVVESADTYTFRLLSDDGSILKIDGYTIIDNDGQHMPRSLRATITLDAGEHDFDLFYYQGPADFIALQLFVTRFEQQERLFGPRL